MSEYEVDAALTLRCSGEHLRGNPFRDEGPVHQASYGGVSWTWTTSEQTR